MAKRTTLNERADMLTHVIEHMVTNEDLEMLATKSSWPRSRHR